MAGKVTPDTDWSKLEGMCMFDASARICADELGFSVDTLERRIRSKYDMTFLEYKKGKLEKTVLRLKQRMIKMGLEGNVTCLIYALKNISDWQDKREVEYTEKEINLKVDEDDKEL